MSDIAIGTRRQYAEQSLKWDAAVASEKSDDELLQRIWNLAEDSLALVAALDRLVAERDAWSDAHDAAQEQVIVNHRRAEAAEAERDEANRRVDGMARAPYGEFDAMRVRAEAAEADRDRLAESNELLVVANNEKRVLLSTCGFRMVALEAERDGLREEYAKWAGRAQVAEAARDALRYVGTLNRPLIEDRQRALYVIESAAPSATGGDS